MTVAAAPLNKVHGKPYSPACDKNKDPILSVLQAEFTRPGRVLEIGSGTGQHAVYFAGRMPHVVWQPTDLAENLPGISAWCQSAALPNLRPPVQLNVDRCDWDFYASEYIFSANTLHIMSWQSVQAFFSGIERALKDCGKLCLYGPFNFGGRYTSESNARFDRWLQERDPLSGVRNFEDLDGLARAAGLRLTKNYAMPANNRTLIWTRSSLGS